MEHDGAGNFIKISRKLLENHIYKDSKYVHLWIHLLLKANWKESKWKVGHQVINIKPGQFVTSRKSLSDDLHISQTTLERMLSVLESGHQIGQQTFSKFRLISITNWDKYQFNGQQIGQQTDSKRTANGQQTDTIEEGKEVKEGKERTIMSGETKPPSPKKQIFGEFENVKLSTTEIEKLNVKFGPEVTKDKIENLSAYMASKKKSYLDHYATILMWARKDPKEIQPIVQPQINDTHAAAIRAKRKEYGLDD